MIKDSKVWNWLDKAMEFIFMPLWKWPATVRHVYLWTYPLAFVLRFVVGILLLLAMILYYLSATAREYFTDTWNGKRPNCNG